MSQKITLQEAWKGNADCQTCELRNSALFAGLTRDDFEHIHEPIVQVSLRPGEALYRAGESGSRVFTLRQGLIKLVRYLPDGTQRIVRLIRSSDVTGLESLLGQPYEHDAIAIQDCELCCLPHNVVNDLSQRNPKLRQELLQRWQRALAAADTWLTELSTGSARQRVARLILSLSDDSEPPLCQLFGREDLGAMLGITTETASRTIADFRRKGWLKDAGQNRYIVDTPAINGVLD
jgi:CRP-like cAMP-binding protein